MDKLTVIVPAAGAGKRLGLGKNKVFAMLGGLPLLVQCLRMINDTGMADKTIIAAGAAEIDAINEMLAKYRELFPLLDTAVVAGGAERTDSVQNALALTGSGGFIAVHDGARPFAGKEVFERTLKAAVKYGAAIAAVPAKKILLSLLMKTALWLLHRSAACCVPCRRRRFLRRNFCTALTAAKTCAARQ